MNPFEFGLTGGLEVLVILLIAFLAIGPGRVMRAARWLGNLGKRVRSIGAAPTEPRSTLKRPPRKGSRKKEKRA